MAEATTKRWLRRLRSDGDVASRSIGRPRGAEVGVCVVCPLHFFVRDLCVCSVGLMIKSGACSCQVLINACTVKPSIERRVRFSAHF